MLPKFLFLLAATLALLLHSASGFRIKICVDDNMTVNCQEAEGNKDECRALTDGKKTMESASLTPSGRVRLYSEDNCPDGKEVGEYTLTESGNRFGDHDSKAKKIRVKSVKFL
jgi:hypothetical protein